MNIVQTYRDVQNTEQEAHRFGAILSADKGVQNEVQECEGGHVVVAGDQKAVCFLHATATKEDKQ